MEFEKGSRTRRFSEAEARKIIESDKSIRELAEHYGVHYSTIRRVLTGNTWFELRQKIKAEKRG